MGLAAPHTQPWSCNAAALSLAQQTQLTARPFCRSPKMARAGPHFCSGLSSATSVGLPKVRSWPLLPLQSSLYSRGTQEEQAAAAASPSLPHLLWQAAPPGEEKSPLLLQNLSHPPDHGFLIELPAGTRPPVWAEHTHWYSPHTPVWSVAFSHCLRAWERQVQISSQEKHGLFPQKKSLSL